MEKQVERLKESQTEVTAGSQWTLTLRGDALRADRLLELENLAVPPAPGCLRCLTLTSRVSKAATAWPSLDVTAAVNHP